MRKEAEPCPPCTLRSCPPREPAELIPERAGRLQTENALTLHQPDLTLRTITGPDELDLFNTLPYVLNDEVGGDLAAGRRRPEWLWLALRGDRVVARAGWWSRAGDQPPLLMDIFDIDGDADDGVRLLKTALPAVVPAGATPPQYARFLPPDWRDHQHARQAVEDRMGHSNTPGQGCSSNGCAWNGDPARPSPNSADGSLSGRFETRASSSNS
jgi:hypothetical protein